MRKFIGALGVAVAIAATTLVAQQGAQQDMAQKTGWWVRVDTKKTEASSVTLQIGTKSGDRRTWRSWHSGDANEFDVPGDYTSVKDLYLQASANPGGKTADFCVFYKDDAAKKFDFRGAQESQMKQADRDDSCK